MISKRNLLCVRPKESLDIGHLLLYEPYKNILINFKKLCIDLEAKDFDPVAKVFDGLLSVPSHIKEYYESLLGVSSYYQHSLECSESDLKETVNYLITKYNSAFDDKMLPGGRDKTNYLADVIQVLCSAEA